MKDDAAPARVAGLATWRISRLHRRAHRLLADRLAGEGVRGVHYRLLAAVAEAGATSQIELGEATGLDRSDVAIALGELADEGLVERIADPQDRRRKIVTLTPVGRKRLRSLDRIVTEVQDDLLAPLSRRDRQAFDRIVSRLLEID